MKNETLLLKAWDGFKGRPQFLFLVAIVFVLSIVTPSFATINNVINILKVVSVIAILACGLTLVVVSGSLDLSIGSAVSLLTVVSATIQLRSDLAAVLVPLAIALALGLFNGLIITSFRVNSIIVTLGALSVFAGAALIYTNGAIIIGTAGTWYSFLGQGKLLGIPFHVVVFVAIAVLCEVVLSYTRFGKALIYIGTNSEAARIAGIRTRGIRIVAFLISALCAAVAGVILSSRMNSGSPVAGVGFEFDAITAIVIGGNSLTGGRGSIRNTIVGVLLLAVIVNALTLYNVPFAFQNITKGVLIILAITVDLRARAKYGK
jgi:ribose/xylose/arabinose/galactoside ABC-type transport system permease subunit